MPLMLFYNEGLGIKLLMKADMPLNKGTEQEVN